MRIMRSTLGEENEKKSRDEDGRERDEEKELRSMEKSDQEELVVEG